MVYFNVSAYNWQHAFCWAILRLESPHARQADVDKCQPKPVGANFSKFQALFPWIILLIT